MVNNLGVNQSECCPVCIIVEADLSVDVQGRGGAARRPDRITLLDGIGKVITRVQGPGPVGAGVWWRWWKGSSKPVLRFLGSVDSTFQDHMASIVGLVDGV